MTTQLRPLLLVEDHELAARSIIRWLQRLTARPVHVYSTVEQVRTACDWAQDFAGAIVDHGLPDGDGFDAIDIIRQHAPNIPLLLFTANDTPEVTTRCYTLGVPYVLKPGGSDTLATFLRRVTSYERQPADTPSDQALYTFIAGKGLSRRELEGLIAALRSESYETAAQTLGVSANTFRTHIRRALRKLGVPSLSVFARLILRKGLSDPKYASPDGLHDGPVDD
jgi:two-component system response regulator FimZ (fimbrial Z protein)